MRYFLKSLWSFALVSLLGVAAMAQRDTGTISGTITDPSGAVVSGATVTATSVSTGITRAATANPAGFYAIPGLKPDAYDVVVEAKGFRKVTRRVEVAVGSSNDVSEKLSLGATNEVVEVSGTAATINTENQTLSQVVTLQQLTDLPSSPIRDPYALVAMSGNVNEDCNSTRGASFFTGECGYAINGQRSSSTDILLDGGENVDTFTASVGQPVPLDSMQEFSVLTNNFTAEYGRAGGGVVSVVTKSGTNSFHGSAYEYNRISDLSANTYQNNATHTPKGAFTRNNFGFSLGGPIKKSKLLFFNNTEWIRVRSNAPQQLTILDPGSVSALAPASQAYFSTFGKLAQGVKTVQTGSCGGSGAAAGLICDQVSFPVPSDAGGGSPQNTWMEVAKVDYNLSDKTTLTGRYASYKEFNFAGTVNFSPYAGYDTGQNAYDQNALFQVTHIFGTNFVNSAKAVYNRINGPIQGLGTAPVGPTLFLTSGQNLVFGTALIFPGYNENTPGQAIPFGGPQNLYEVYDDASWTHGNHEFKFGGQYIHLRDNRVFGAYLNANEILGSTSDTGLNNLVAGNILQFSSAVYPQGKFPCPKNINGVAQVSPACTVSLPVSKPDFERNFHYNDLAFYGQDSWKIRPRFTANLGLRWEYFGVQHNANPALDSNFVMGPGPTIFDRVRNGAVELAQNGGVFWHPRYGNFGPRIGFAWDLFGDGKTALRGGYGISFERNFGNVTFNAIQNPPNYAVLNLLSNVDVPQMPVYVDNNGPLGGSTGTKALPAVSQRAIDQNMKTAYAQAYNLTVDRQITTHSVLTLGYAGSHGVHLYDISNLNPVAGHAYLGDAHASNRINLQYGNMNFRSDLAYSHYNAFNAQFKANNLFSKGVGLIANYTWSHALDNLSSTFSDQNLGQSSGLYALGYLDEFNPKLNFGNADFDIRHRFALSGTWDVPWGKNASNSILRSVLGGWGLGTTFNIRSGSPFSVYDCTHRSQNGNVTCPMYIAPSPVPKTGSAVAAGPNIFNYIMLPNTAGKVNNLGDGQGIATCTGLFHTGTCTYDLTGLPYPERNQFYGPRNWSFNQIVFKNFKITEQFQLQFRAEAYNIFNHHNQYVQTENLDATSLGGAFIQSEKGGPVGVAGTAFDERRNLQFGLRLIF